MLNTDAYLNKKLFTNHATMTSVTEGVSKGLLACMKKNRNVLMLSNVPASIAQCQTFDAVLADRFFSLANAEQSAMTMSIGLANAGKIPFLHVFARDIVAIFSILKNSVAETKCNIKIIGHCAEFSTERGKADGAEFHDVMLMRLLPAMVILTPGDALEAQKAIVAAASIDGPVYIRITANVAPAVTTEKTPFIPGIPLLLWESFGRRKKSEVLLLESGPFLAETLDAARSLEEKGIGSVAFHCGSVSPLQTTIIEKYAEQCGHVAVIEDRLIRIGFSDAIASNMSGKAIAIERAVVDAASPIDKKSDNFRGLQQQNSHSIEAAARRLLKK